MNSTPETPVVTVSLNWEYEDLAIIAAHTCAVCGECAVVVQVSENDVRVFSWKV